LINTNKSAIVAKVKNFRELNTPQTNYVQSQTECCYYLQQWWQYYRQRFRYLFLSSSITRSKRESFLQKDLEEREYSNLGCVYLLQQQDLKERILSANGSRGERILKFRSCLSWHSKWISCIDTLLEADTVLSETHFAFGCPYGSLVGDSLSSRVKVSGQACTNSADFSFQGETRCQTGRICPTQTSTNGRRAFFQEKISYLS
jgi:hypothetical protein